MLASIHVGISKRLRQYSKPWVFTKATLVEYGTLAAIAQHIFPAELCRITPTADTVEFSTGFNVAYMSADVCFAD